MPLPPLLLPIAVILLVAIPPTNLEVPYRFQNPGRGALGHFRCFIPSNSIHLTVAARSGIFVILALPIF